MNAERTGQPAPETGPATAAHRLPTAAAMADLVRGYADPSDKWRIRADQLETLLTELAGARRRAAVAYAEAFIAAEGTQQYRAATAELAAAAPREDVETLEGRAEAFRMILAAERRTDALTAADCRNPWHGAPAEARRGRCIDCETDLGGA